MMIQELLKRYEDELIRQDKSRNTISAYISDIEKFIEWYNGTTDEGIEKVTMLDLKDYRDYLTSKRKAVSTINRKIASINKFMDYLSAENVIDKNFKLRQVRKNVKSGFKGLENKEVKSLRKEVHRNGNKRDILIIELLLNTGLRVSELCDIKLSAIAVSDRKGKFSVIGKGMKERELQLNKVVRRVLDDYLKVRPKSTSDYLFVGQRGKLTRNGVFKCIKKYSDRLGIEVSPHTLRHTLARKLLASGSDITIVQGILGHQSIETTSLYTKSTQDEMDNDLESLNW